MKAILWAPLVTTRTEIRVPSPLYGQLSITASAQQLTSNRATVTAFTIKAPASNSNPVYLGDSAVTTSTGFQLDPGDEVDYECVNQAGQPNYQLRPSDFYAIGTVGDKATWLASP